ncbi:MAG: TetR/AcrR family transcriptional regulator [Gammaproteobacteria bacterium]|nr:TetR/AcrR family transcriptional regulator [Gammaproteobacteria bacterium]
MAKNRLKTEQRILDAVKHILLHEGFPAIGINSIARQANCDKVLIYRYFDGLGGLLLSIAETTELWWQVDEIISESPDQTSRIPLHEYLKTLLERHAAALQARPLTLEIMAWEMSEQNNLTVALARIRAQRGMELVKKIRIHYQNPIIDIGGILGVFGAAINYLVIRTRRDAPQHMTEEWWRLQQTISKLLDTHA